MRVHYNQNEKKHGKHCSVIACPKNESAGEQKIKINVQGRRIKGSQWEGLENAV